MKEKIGLFLISAFALFWLYITFFGGSF